MTYAVSLIFNTELGDAISARWQRLADAGVSRSMLELGYLPHVTLAVFDRLNVDAAAASLDGIFKDVARLDVTLSGITTFGAGSGVCYAALASSPDLTRLHAGVLGALGETCRPHYQAGHWTPHCTLAVNLSDAQMDCAKDLLEPDWQPLAGAFEIADLVEFVPVLSIKRWTLSSIPRSSRTP
jgi:2'-5' RNA ligase